MYSPPRRLNRAASLIEISSDGERAGGWARGLDEAEGKKTDTEEEIGNKERSQKGEKGGLCKSRGKKAGEIEGPARI